MSPNKTLNDIAYEHFQEATSKIEQIKKGIQENRMGEATLTDIQTDSSKLSKRIARENLPISAALERINGVPNFQDVQILYKILKISESVGRITIKTRYGNSGYGTGFLVAPGILITNNHVFPDVETARNSVVQFYYELDENNETKKIQTFGFVPEKFFLTSNFLADPAIPNSGLDFTVVAVSEKSKEGRNIEEIPHTILDETLGKIIEGENCVVIQHPKGDYKKTVMKDIRMLTLKDDFLIYESDTLPGSSGAVVIGLGTGEVVALHHSSIPNKNPQGQWLRKDGGVYKDGDPDESIDWLGNEGIRVSSLIRGIRNAVLPEEMINLRSLLFGREKKEEDIPKKTATPNPALDMKNSTESVLNDAVNMIPQSAITDDLPLLYFEIELSNILMMQEDWKENYKKLVPEIVSSEPLFPFSTILSQKAMHYVTLKSKNDPWELAARLETLPQIRTATPDLEMNTDMNTVKNSDQLTESEMLENMKINNAAGRQDDFKAKWSASPYFDLTDSDLDKQRTWSRIAVGFGSNEKKTFDLLSFLKVTVRENEKKSNSATPERTSDVLENLKNIKLVQLDTGYTDHAKVKGRFNFNCDEDFIDGSDARDDLHAGFTGHPGHGTRIASIITGGDMSGIFTDDGNYGILCDTDKNTLLDIIPYRIAETVTLINRAKNIVAAANQAIHTSSDVLLMSMGSYPRPMVAEAAKAAYDNGVIWVCAAGNEVEHVVSPALYPGTIAVAASNPNGKPWRGSSYGPEVDVSAPGEDIYVPTIDEKDNEIMVYGSGTGYAAAHVAAAAALWKAKNRSAILAKFPFPWQVAEAFRISLKRSATKPAMWNTENYGAGILNIPELLKMELPDVDADDYAYKNDSRQEWDLGVREAIHVLWKNDLNKKPSATESTRGTSLTERSRIAITAMTGNSISGIFEADNATAITDADKILKMYFDSYTKN